MTSTRRHGPPSNKRSILTVEAVAAREIIAHRVKQDPDSPFYTYAAAEMARIDSYLAGVPRPNRPFYDSLTRGTGLMCAKELEVDDLPFCDVVYKMLKQIRLQTISEISCDACILLG